MRAFDPRLAKLDALRGGSEESAAGYKIVGETLEARMDPLLARSQMSGATPPRASASRESTMRTRTRPLPSMYGMSVKSIVPRQSAAIWHLSPIATPSALDPGTASRRRAPTECTMGAPSLRYRHGPSRHDARQAGWQAPRSTSRPTRARESRLARRARGRRAARRRERGHGAGLCARSLIFASSHELAIGTPAQM